MDKINTISAAKRLAEAILADIRRYNADAVQRGDDLSNEIAEGRALYQGRVKPLLYPLFEQALESSGIRATAPTKPAHATSPASATTTTPATRNMAWFVFGLLGLGATIAWQLLR